MSSLTLQDPLFKKIYEIIKEFKDFKFQQNLRIELMNLLKIKYLQTHGSV